MRRMLVGLALALVALPAWAQTQQQYFWCASSTFTKDQRIAGCTAIIRSGRYGGTHTLAMAYNNRAWAYHEKGEDAKGLPDAEQAVVLEPIPSRLDTRAEIYEKLGRRDQAIIDYRAALKLDQNYPAAINGLTRLGAKP